MAALSHPAEAIRDRLSLLFGLLRFARGLDPFLGQAITSDEARRTIIDRMSRREAAFLDFLRRAVFPLPRSPYRALLRLAGLELGDVEVLVRQEGLEGALGRLRDAGVYVDFEEFKGRAPAVRGSRTLRFRSADFDNPLVRPHFAARSGGSRGAPTRTLVELDYLADRAALWCMWFAEHELLDAPLIFVTPYHPGSVNLHLLCARFGSRFVRWFATAGAGSPGYRAVAAYLNGLTRRAARFPRPEFVGPDDLPRVGRYLAGLVGTGQRPCVNTSPSVAIRIGRGLGGEQPLRGVTFLLGYEPLTATRRAAIEALGARAAMTYGFAEGGTVGQQCRRPVEPDDVHVAGDAFAVLRGIPGAADPSEAGSLLLTSLLPTTPKVLLNTSIGDVGVLETRRCGCLLDELGHRQRLHTIRSTKKVTGEGVTFLGPDVAQVLEEVLPRRFGGGPTDYQLVEEEAPGGLARYRLLVHPDVEVLDEQQLADTFLAALARVRPAYRFMIEQWIGAGQLQVVRARPLPTARGKLLPIRTLHSR